ncbi:MAG: energy-coupling factor ABC transporter ATP-binding protein [Candidatus Thorarchaeota archaeon]
MTCAIDINHVFFRYADFRMEDINLQLHVGEQKALVGLNGSGKTTLFKLILGLLKPDSGDIFVFDRKNSKDTLWEMRQNVGFLFQNPDDQLFAPTVWEDVAFGPRNLGLSEEEVADRVEWALDRVGMSKYVDRAVNQMSHGEAKRVALAGLIAMRPGILILDEPFTGLDFKMVTAMIEIIQKLRQDGISIIFTTHNRFFIENWSDSVAVIKDGRIVYDGPTRAAMKQPEVIENIGDWSHLKEQIHSFRKQVI